MSDFVLCANCGKPNPPGSTSCEHCTSARRAQKPNWVVSVGIGLLVYLAGCNVGLVLRHAYPPTPAAPAAISAPAR